jgi:hypothetical protein
MQRSWNPSGFNSFLFFASKRQAKPALGQAVLCVG